MSPDPQQPGSVRSSTDLNEEIRALWTRAGGKLSPDERREYEALLEQWAAAVRAELGRAA